MPARRTTRPRTLDLRGKTVRWTFEDGPTAGQAYEHRIGDDRSIAFRQAGAKSWTEAVDGTVGNIGDCAVVSYLSQHGYTLTAILDPRGGSVLAYASNEAEWTEQHGTFEVVRAVAPSRARRITR